MRRRTMRSRDVAEAALKAGSIVLIADKRRAVAAIKTDDGTESVHFEGRHSVGR